MIAVLFARSDSVYKTLPGCDVWDIDRDARSWGGGSPVVAHPPCRAWAKLSQFAKPRQDEKELAIFAVEMVRRFGGVVEHPITSRLFATVGVAVPGRRDKFGGFVYPVDQSLFGHRAPKRTGLYIVGVEPGQLPAFPFRLGVASGRVELMGKRERESTPVEFARWLVEIASRCGSNA